jgi:UDP-N-acetylmuramate--alanine ligase
MRIPPPPDRDRRGRHEPAKLLPRGIAVSGSDLKDSKGLAELRVLGADVQVGHDPAHVRAPDPDAVVVSSAIGDRNVELVEARRRDTPVWARAQALAALTAGTHSIAVAGTHGKTTTTSMVAVVLEGAGLDPSFLIGGDLNESGSGARSGDGDLFVFEADESDGSFLLASIGWHRDGGTSIVDFHGRPTTRRRSRSS